MDDTAIPVKWSQVRPNARVILPTGRIVWCLWVNAGIALLRDKDGDTKALPVDPDAVVPMLVGPPELAAASLAERFPEVQFLRAFDGRD
jgi:hypothetical protein